MNVPSSPALLFQQLFAELNNLRNDEDFSDVTLEAEGVNVSAQKLILVAASPYFKSI